MKKVIIMIIVLSVLLLGAVGYIGYGFYSDARLQKDSVIFQNGAQYGYEGAISQLIKEIETCQQVPITYDNKTLNIVAVECLKQQE